MTLDNFSSGFDTLLVSYQHTAAFGQDTAVEDIRLDEFEKSLYLTMAQEDIALSLYNGRNSSGNSFEETEELRRYLSPLIVEAQLPPITNTSGRLIGMEGKNSYFFTLPDGSGDYPAVWFITYESVTLGENAPCGEGSQMEVIPVKQDEYHRIRKNPFRGANNRRALRLDLSDDNVEIISKYDVASYYIRYIRKLKPIILTDLTGEQEIQGYTKPSGCEMDDSLHQRILERAVVMALQSRGYRNNNRENN